MRASLLAGLLAVLVSPSQDPGVAKLSPEQWKDDLRFMVKELSAKHKNLFHTVTQADFNRAAADLDARIPGLSSDRIVLEFKRLVSMVGDGHTRLSLGQPVLRFRQLPIVLFIYPEGLYIIPTFSAGLMAAIDLKHGRFFREPSDPGREQRTRTVLVGEPTGAKPNSYSERAELTLPTSRIIVSYSRLFWELAPELGHAPSLQPDLLAPTFARG